MVEIVVWNFSMALDHWQVPAEGPRKIPRYFALFVISMISNPGQLSLSHSLTKLEFGLFAKIEKRTSAQLEGFSFRPETLAKFSKIHLTSGRSARRFKTILISSAHALVQPKAEPSSLTLNMCKRGSMEMTTREPHKGQPCRTPERIMKMKESPSCVCIYPLLFLYERQIPSKRPQLNHDFVEHIEYPIMGQAGINLKGPCGKRTGHPRNP